MVSKAFGASKYSPATADALLKAAARSGTSAAALGISDEEVLAATAIVSTGKGGAEEGGTYLAALMRTIRQKGEFKGKSLKDTIDQIQAMTGGMDEETAKAWFGRAQGREAFDILRVNLSRYGEALGEVREAQDQDRVGTKLKLAATDPAIRATQEARIAEAREELSREKLGVFTNEADKAVNDYAVKAREEGKSEWEIFGTRRYAGIKRFFQGDEGWLAGREGEVGSVIPEARRDLMGVAFGRERMQGAEALLEFARPGLERIQEQPGNLQRQLGLAMPTVAAPAAPAPENIHDLADLGEKFERATENLVDAGRDAGRGPTLVPPNVDR